MYFKLYVIVNTLHLDYRKYLTSIINIMYINIKYYIFG